MYDFVTDNTYTGKHEKKHYNVWRVLGPAGPEETFTVYGIEEAGKAILGCWDWEVTAMNGNTVEDSVLVKYASYMHP